MNNQENIKDFLNPEKYPFPDTVPLPPHLNPFLNDGVDIIPVIIYNPTFQNMKVPVALQMLEDAEKKGLLRGVHTLVEATSGNTGYALGILAPYFGIRRVIAVVKRDTAPGKLEQLRLAGVEIHFASQDKTPINEAKEMGAQDGYLNLNQYGNDANWKAHYGWTGPHVWKQTNGKISVFCAGLGTTGTLIGASRFLKERNQKITVVGIILAPESAIPGVRTEKDLRQIEFDWGSFLHRAELVETKSAYQKSRALCLAGIMAGPSSGFAYAGALKFIQETKEAGQLDGLRNSEGRVVVAFTCGDTPFPYLEKYSMILDSEDFNPLDPLLVQQ